MDEREIYWIDYFKSTDPNIGYNLSEGGRVNRTLKGINSPNYGKKRSEETKLKISQALKGKQLSDTHRDNVIKALKSRKHLTWSDTIKGKNMSDNHKNNISKALKGKPKSENHKINMSLARKGKPLSDKQIAANTARRGKTPNRDYTIKYIWINNGLESHKIKESDADKWLVNDNFKRGRLYNRGK